MSRRAMIDKTRNRGAGRRPVARAALGGSGVIAVLLAFTSVAWACTWADATTQVVPVAVTPPSSCSPSGTVFVQGCPIKVVATGVFVGLDSWYVHEVSGTAPSVLVAEAEAAAGIHASSTTIPHPATPTPHPGTCGNDGASTGDGLGSANPLGAATSNGGKIISTSYANGGATVPSGATVPATWATATLTSQTGLQLICFAATTQKSETVPVAILVLSGPAPA